MRFIIFGNGEIDNYSFAMEYLKGKNIIIACDGGVSHVKKLHIYPDYIIGDFDSAAPEIMEEYAAENISIIPYPVEKDYTDMELCINFAIENKATEIIIFGGIGSRLDHTLANIDLLSIPLKNGIKTSLISENSSVYLIDDKISINGKKGDLISLIPFKDDVTGVTTKNLYYPLSDETLFIGSSRGVSNVFNESKIEVSIKSGKLLLIKTKEQ